MWSTLFDPCTPPTGVTGGGTAGVIPDAWSRRYGTFYSGMDPYRVHEIRDGGILPTAHPRTLLNRRVFALLEHVSHALQQDVVHHQPVESDRTEIPLNRCHSHHLARLTVILARQGTARVITKPCEQTLT